MSQYTTGELAKRCGVTVRTVQYYDTRGILSPSALTEGGRRLYSEEDLGRLQIILFLRELGLSIDTIGKLLAEEDPGSVIVLLLEQQERVLREELHEKQEKLDMLQDLKKQIKGIDQFRVESIGDIARNMEGERNRRRFYRIVIPVGIVLGLLEILGLVLWIGYRTWWPFALWAALAVPFGICVSKAYYDRVAYLCPKCQARFQPRFREMVFAVHTSRTRRLICTECGHKGFCVEDWGGKNR